jgi:hypothetical protein
LAVINQEYVEKDARENKARIDAENKLLKEKLDKEAAELKRKLQVKMQLNVVVAQGEARQGGG